MSFASISTPPIPAPFTLALGDNTFQSNGNYGANYVYLIGVYTPTPFPLSAIRTAFNVAAGYFDVGIYDALGGNDLPGNLLAHAAATATSLPASGSTAPPLIGGTYLVQPGRYWLALWLDNSSARIFFTYSPGPGAVLAMGGSITSGPLPASASSISGLTNTLERTYLEGLRAGGWS